MHSLAIFLLGPPRIESEGATARVDTRKATALMAYLAVTGEGQRRDGLAGLLWPDSDQVSARAALRRTLSTLNKALGRQGLVIQRETVGLDWDAGPWIDLVEFRRRLSSSRDHPHPSEGACDDCLSWLSEAVRLYRGDFLEGFTLRDSSVFDDWQLGQSEALRMEMAGVLERLEGIHAAKGDLKSAIDYSRRWLSLDPLDEKVHRRLIQLYAWDGQRAAALRQYRECVRILDQELGVAPLEETTRLYQTVRESRVSAPPVTARPRPVMARSQSSMATRPPTDFPERQRAYPMVGRAAELQALIDAYRSIRDDGRLLVLTGEAGIGKTRLAEEFLSHLRAIGATTIATRCFRGETGLAYGPFVEALCAAIADTGGDGSGLGWSDHWLSEAARLVPDANRAGRDIPVVPPLDSPGAQRRFFEAIGHILSSISREGRPGALLVDDLHWADEASLDLLTFMVRRLRGQPICIVATWRTELEAGGRLRGLLAEAKRSGVAASVPLTRLTLSNVTELIRGVQAAGQPPPGAIIDRLYRETEGLPFFLVEYLESRRRDRGWTADEPWEMPSGVRDLLRARLDSVSETERQLLDAAAVIGRSFDFRTLQESSGRQEEEAVAALDGLLSRDLVNELGRTDKGTGITYDFSHEQLQALVYEETSLARRRLLHRRVAEAMIARFSRESDRALASTIGQHLGLAGRNEEASWYFKLAGDHAAALYANAEAMGHYRSSLVLGHRDPAGLNAAIGDLQTLGGEYGQAISSYETAASLCRPDALAGVEGKLGGVYLRRGDWQVAASHFEAALAGLADPGDLALRSSLHADLSLTAHRTGDADKAQEEAALALELGEEAGDPQSVAQAHNIVGILARSRGDLPAARYHLALSLDIAEHLDHSASQVAALNNLALAQWGLGELDAAIALAERALSLCSSLGDRHREAALHNSLSDLLHTSGSPDAAMEHLEQAVAIFADIGEDAGAMQPEIWKLVEW